MRIKRRRVRTAWAAVAAVFLASCSTGDSSGQSTMRPEASSVIVTPPPSTSAATGTNPSPTTVASSPVLAASQQADADAALDVYRKMWAAMVQAAVDPDPANPELAKFATGSALQKLQYSLAVDRENGFTSKGTLHFAPRVASVSSSAVEIVDCTDDSTWLKYNQDGTLKGDAPGGKRNVKATVTSANAGWKVSDLHVDGVGTCT